MYIAERNSPVVVLRVPEVKRHNREKQPSECQGLRHVAEPCGCGDL